MKDLDNYMEDWLYVIAYFFTGKTAPGYECFWKKYFYKHCIGMD